MIVSGGVILTVTVVLSWFDSGFSIGRFIGWGLRVQICGFRLPA